jgi:phosphoribosylformylglycinamidine cyclo-ligase
MRYKTAGVDIDAGDGLVERIKPLAAATKVAGTVGSIGGFGGVFDPKAAGFLDPLLVAATDGVGTKLRIAIETGRHGTVGIDLVAMCTNDLLAQGAKPLFFLDYYAAGKLDQDAAFAVIQGIAEGCRQAGCVLIGGETAEMPGMYAEKDYDLAGFAVGAVERGALLPREARPGDALIGVPSSGVHSNGLSLVRKVIKDGGFSWDGVPDFAADGRTFADVFLTPTIIYERALRPLIDEGRIVAVAHITGGGIDGNLPRVLPDSCGAEIDLSAWTPPPEFGWLARHGDISEEDMRVTFNCGLGLILAVRQEHEEAVLSRIGGAKRIGKIVPRREEASVSCLGRLFA